MITRNNNNNNNNNNNKLIYKAPQSRKFRGAGRSMMRSDANFKCYMNKSKFSAKIVFISLNCSFP